MTKNRIAVDVDEVLFPFVEEFVKFDNARYGGNFATSDFNSYAFETILNSTLGEAVERVYEFNRADHDAIEPITDAKDAIARLSQRHDLFIVTARHPDFKGATDRWVRDVFGDVFQELHHIGYAPIMERPVKKVDICRELGATALIDDSVGHVSECAQEGIDGVLFGNYPWNQTDYLPSGVTRCENWLAVEDHFESKAL